VSGGTRAFRRRRTDAASLAVKAKGTNTAMADNAGRFDRAGWCRRERHANVTAEADVEAVIGENAAIDVDARR
jgi:hypothetical protein